MTAAQQASGLIRIGGIASLAAFIIHIVVNMGLKEFPPDNASLDELKAYFSREADVWALVHGLRYVAIAGMIIFIGGIYARTAPVGHACAPGWAIVGLVGGALHMASLFITNGIETFAFLGFEEFSEKPELFWLVFRSTRVLFTAEIASWSVFIFGFSLAGWQTARLPKWICLLGFISAIACIASGLFIGSILGGGWATPIALVAEMTVLGWFLSVGIVMLVRGDR